jgi:type I restriction enzyme M protein
MRIQTSIKQHVFFMPLATIRENNWDLSINRYKEINYKEVVYDEPTTILRRIQKADLQRNLILEKLQKNL